MRAGSVPRFFIFCCCALAGGMAAGAEPLFPATSAAPLSVELRLPFTDLKRDRRNPDAEVEAELQLPDGAVLPLKVRPRGKSRLERCDYFPLWLDFAKKKTAGTVFAGQNKLKLVTHCSDKYRKSGFLARELLVYQMLNRFTEISFRVRPVIITYVDTNKDDWQRTREAFVIEHKDALATRTGGELLRVDEVPIRDMDSAYASFISLFQYFVGNTDFSLRKGPAGDTCCHNAVPLRIGESVFSVPYDFDVTGFVNPPYAVPQQALGITRVTQRKYRGYCAHSEQLEAARRRFMDEQAGLFAGLEEFDQLSGLRPDKSVKFLQPFFKVLAEPRQFERKVLRRCLG